MDGGLTELVAGIREAFPDPGWGNRDPSGEERGVYEGELVRANFTGQRWRDTPDGYLRAIGRDLWAFTPEALQYFLPAFVLCALERADVCAAFEESFWEVLLNFFPLHERGFTPRQIALLRDALAFIDRRDWDSEDNAYAVGLLGMELEELGGHGAG